MTFPFFNAFKKYFFHLLAKKLGKDSSSHAYREKNAGDLKSLASRILDQGFLMSLATADENGLWVCDVIYAHDSNFNIYWLSQAGTRHSKAILKNIAVAAAITVSNNPGEQNVGLQLSGTAEKIEGDILEVARIHRRKRGKPEPEKKGDILDAGESWYRLRLQRVEIIYEPLWGFEKRILELR